MMRQAIAAPEVRASTDTLETDIPARLDRLRPRPRRDELRRSLPAAEVREAVPFAVGRRG